MSGASILDATMYTNSKMTTASSDSLDLRCGRKHRRVGSPRVHTPSIPHEASRWDAQLCCSPALADISRSEAWQNPGEARHEPLMHIPVVGGLLWRYSLGALSWDGTHAEHRTSASARHSRSWPS